MGAEVGVLELQIHDNSAKAASGLGNLASALTRVQNALGSGLRLGSTANQIGKIVEKMQSAIPEESVSRIERLANAMEKLSAAGRISIPNLKGLKVDSVKEATNAAKENDPFETMASTASAISERHEEIVERVREENVATIKAREAMDTIKDSTEKAASEAAELSEEMTPAKETIQATKEEARQLKEELQSASSAAQKINTGNWKSFNPKTGMFEDDPSIKSVADLYAQIDQRRQEAEARGRENVIEHLRKDFSNSPTNVQDTVLGFHGLTREEVFPSEVADGAAELAGAAENAREALSDVQETGKDLGKTLNDTANNGTSKLREAFDNLKDSVSKMASPLSGLVGQLAKVARYRMLRAIVKQIAEGFKEGVENYYHYSEAVNNGFSAAMDRAATSLQTFKNSIGAAVAPLIQALIPILQQVVTWVVTAINYVNQFIALLSGKTTWSKAIDTTAKAFENTKKKAGGASKAIKKTDNAVKDLLADFDELNIIQSQTGDNGGSGSGGGGGGVGKTATDFKKMFTEVSKFDNGIKQLVDNLKKNFGSILNLATEIGAAVLAWKVSSAFSGVIAQAAGLIGSAVIMDIVFRLSKSFTSTFLDTGDEGWLLMSGLTPLVGGFIARKLMNQIGLKGVGKYAIPIALAVSATADISALVGDADVSALSAESIETAVMSALKMGGAVGIALNAAGVLTAAGAAGAGVAAALLTFGVAIGLKATREAMDVGEITTETIKADIVSALSVGGALAIGAAIVGGTAGTIVAAGALGAVLTFGALVAVQAVLKKDQEEPVVWGGTTFTQEEIEDVVGKMFTVNPKVRMELLESKIEVSKQSKANLKTAVENSLEKLEILKIGLDTTDSLEELKKAVFTNPDSLMNQFKEHAKGQQTLVATTLEFAFIPDENGNNTAQESAKNINNGWSKLEGDMAELGRKLTAAMDQAYTESLDGTISKKTQETINKLTGMMADISAAVSYGKTAASSMSGFKAMAKGLTQATTDEVIAYYAQMKDELIAAEMEALKETADSALALSYAYQYLADHADTDADRLKYSNLAKNYSDEYTKIIDNAANSAKETVEKRLSNDEDVTGFAQGMLDNITEAGWNDLKFNAVNSNDLWTSIIGPMISPDGTVQENAVKDMRGMLQTLLRRAFGDENAESFIGAIDAGMMGWNQLISPEIVKSIAESMGLAKESKEVRNAFVEMIQGIFGKEGYTKDTILPEIYVEQPVEVEMEPEVSDEGGFDWSNYDFGAGNFEFELTDFHGAGTMAEWEDLWDAMFSNGTGTEAAANALRGRLDEIVEMAFLGTGQGSKILEALKNGDLNYGDVIQQSVLQSIEEALGLEYDSPEIQEKWNAILDEIFGGEYTPELEIDPELTGKTSGFKPFNPNQLIASAGMSSFAGGHGYGGQTPEETAAGVQAGTAAIQTDLQTGMATRQSDIQSGVQTGTSGLLAAINNLLSVAQAINNKQFTVNIVPSTTLGVVTRRSGQGLSRVTGNLEAPT